MNTDNAATRATYSLVIPIFNEEETLPELHKRVTSLMDNLDGDSEVVLVDDGSSDHSYEMMVDIHKTDPRFKVIQLSRNFGHQLAITAGMDFATGDAVIIMDADLQDPPEVVIEMARQWRDGYHVVYGVREDRSGETWFKRTTASLFYRLLHRLTDLDIPVDVGDFRLVDRTALDAFRSMREHSRYVRGMFCWIGFKQTGVRYKRSERFAGRTKYPFARMLKLALDGILGFSTVPLQLALHAGFILSAMSFIYGIIALFAKMSGYFTVPGWSSLITVVTFIGGIQLMLLGVIGEYIGRIYDEVRKRPLYLIRDSRGTGESAFAFGHLQDSVEK